MSKKRKVGVIGTILKAIFMFYVYLFKGIFWIFKGIGLGIKKLIECILKLSPEEQHKLAIGVQFLFSLVLVVAGFFGIFSSGTAMIFIVILGLILNPKLCDLLNIKLKDKNIVIDTTKRITAGIISFVLMCALFPKSNTTPQEVSTISNDTSETTSNTETADVTTLEELKLGFSFDDSFYERIFEEIYPFGYDEEVSVDTKKKMNVADRYGINVSEVTEIINYFKDGKNKDISYIIVSNPSGTTVATTTIATTKPTTTEEKITEPPQVIEQPKINNQSKTVYITPTGKKYHYDNHCNGGSYNPSTLEEALSLGLEPCKKCVG